MLTKISYTKVINMLTKSTVLRNAENKIEDLNDGQSPRQQMSKNHLRFDLGKHLGGY